MKRGFALSCVHSALAMTRRSPLQLLRVDQLNSVNRRAGLPLVLLSFLAWMSLAAIALASRLFFARPKM